MRTCSDFFSVSWISVFYWFSPDVQFFQFLCFGAAILTEINLVFSEKTSLARRRRRQTIFTMFISKFCTYFNDSKHGPAPKPQKIALLQNFPHVQFLKNVYIPMNKKRCRESQSRGSPSDLPWKEGWFYQWANEGIYNDRHLVSDQSSVRSSEQRLPRAWFYSSGNWELLKFPPKRRPSHSQRFG